MTESIDQPPSLAELAHCLSAALSESLDAIALLDRRSGHLLWCSDEFSRQFADARIGFAWRSWPESVVVDSGLHADGESLIHVNQTSGVPVALSWRQVSEHCSLVRSWPPGTPSSQLHHYLQARNDLLVTASTLSVSEMATSLAHEINQPVGAITNLLEGMKLRLRRDPPMLDGIEQALEKALDQARFTASVVGRIRDFTRERRPSMARHDASALVREALQLLDWLLSNQACRLEIECPLPPVWIECDATLFQQVVINLVRNAIEAMHATPVADRVLSVQLESGSTEVRIAIADRGHGLADSEETLFVPFITSKSDGMGVGLNICRSFIELHQGRLWLTSNLEGGCTAWISLPSTSSETLSDRTSAGRTSEVRAA